MGGTSRQNSKIILGHKQVNLKLFWSSSHIWAYFQDQKHKIPGTFLMTPLIGGWQNEIYETRNQHVVNLTTDPRIAHRLKTVTRPLKIVCNKHDPRMIMVLLSNEIPFQGLDRFHGSFRQLTLKPSPLRLAAMPRSCCFLFALLDDSSSYRVQRLKRIDSSRYLSGSSLTRDSSKFNALLSLPMYSRQTDMLLTACQRKDKQNIKTGLRGILVGIKGVLQHFRRRGTVPSILEAAESAAGQSFAELNIDSAFC